MAARILLAIALIVIGSGLNVPIAIVLGLVTLMVEVVHAAVGAGRRPRRPLHAHAGRPPGGVRRRDPDADRGLEPPPAAAAVVARRRRGLGRRPSSASATSRTAKSPGPRSSATPGRCGRGSGSCAGSMCPPTGAACSGWARGPVRGRPVRQPRGRGPAPDRRHVPRSGRARSRPPRSSHPTAGATSTARGRASPRTRHGSPASARMPRATRCGGSTPGPAPGWVGR